jgi:3-phenylpropionate/trans-cinnamate dioxygenase ferredoxin reductase subunit
MSGIVIVGAGQAAGQAAASLRQEKYEGLITIIGDEAQPPYQRPPLSKQYLSGELGIDRVLVRPEKFYLDQNISLHTGTRVESIDTARKSLATDLGDIYNYDKLLIATGSRPRTLTVPGSNLSGIHYLRTIDDVDGIIKATKTAKKICIVGGGYIGLEVAAIGVSLGLDVTVLEMEERILQRVTTPKMSQYYHELHAYHGVKILLNAGVTSFEGDHSVSKVLCNDQTLNADLVIVGIGILPNVELAEAAGLKCENGIIVDEHCRTSNSDVYSAGDCTNHPNPILDRRLRLESVPNAMEQARVSASNMLGGNKVYASVPWFWSDQYGLKLQMVGFSADGDTNVLRGDMATNQFAVFYLKNGKVVSVDAVNSPKEFMICKQLYGKEVDPLLLADANVELKTLLN